MPVNNGEKHMEGNEVLVNAGVDLAAVAVKNTAAFISDRIKVAKANKGLQEQNNEFQDIINDLLNDKSELLRITHIYEQELASQKITDDDIEFITKNIFPILRSFVADDQKGDFDKLKKLLSKEMITILQLVGFNYKKAIGEPLTRLVGNYIESMNSRRPESQEGQNEVTLAMIELAKDKESFERFKEMISWGKAGN